MKASCWVCPNTFEAPSYGAVQGKHSGGYFGVCPQCRINAHIGRMVQNMKPGHSLGRDDFGWLASTIDQDRHGKTAAEALEKAGCGEEG